MKRNRDYTFYTLCYDHEEIDGKRFIDLSQRREIEQIADRFEGDFIGSHAYQKWGIEYYFSRNNEAFLDHLAEFDTPAQVHDILHEQLYNYIERTPVVPSVSILEDPAILTNQWLENTRFICKQAYKKTGNEVYKLAVKWCKWKKEQIDTRHGLDRTRDDETLPKVNQQQSTLINKDEKQKDNKPQPADNELGSKRQRILMHFYEDGKMVERRHKDYNDYILYATELKRLAYPNESQSKLKHLIRDIEIVKNFLSEKAKQRADKELNTLKLKLSEEK